MKIDHSILSRRPDQELNNKGKRTCHRVDFAIPVDHRVKIKESKKIDKYLDLAGEREKNCETQKVTVIPIVFGAPGMVPKDFKKDRRNWK